MWKKWKISNLTDENSGFLIGENWWTRLLEVGVKNRFIHCRAYQNRSYPDTCVKPATILSINKRPFWRKINTVFPPPQQLNLFINCITYIINFFPYGGV